MKFLFDIFPIFVFFVAFKKYGIFAATLTTIIATLILLIYFRIKNGNYQKIHVFSFFSVLILGGATILLKDEMFIKMKTTFVYWLLSIAFLFTQLVQKKPLIQQLAQDSIELPARVWNNLNASWALFFILMGAINLIVIYKFDTATWVNFKFFGTLCLTSVFVLLQGIYTFKHLRKIPGNNK